MPKQKKKIIKLKSIGFQTGHLRQYKEEKEQQQEEDKQSENNVRNAPRIVRLPKDIFEDVIISSAAKCTTGLSFGSEATINNTLLRPSLPRKEQIDDTFSKINSEAELNTYRLLHLSKTADLFNEGFKEHAKLHPNCYGSLTWDIDREEKWGICWREALKCTSCKYKSNKKKLYDEIAKQKPGQKAAALNRALQVGIMQNSIGNTGIRNILQCTNIPPPSYSSMQKNSNNIGHTLESLNKSDMQKVRTELKTISELRFAEREKPINIEADARYNNGLYSGGGKTPFQPATQCTMTFVENETPRKKIINVYNANKLCRNFNCQNGNQKAHEGHCSQNIKPDEIIGNEHEWAYRCSKSLLESPDSLSFSCVTTDGDSKLAKGIQAAVTESENPTEIINLKCTRHLSQSQKRALQNAKFSTVMFPGKNAKEREKNKKRFVFEIKNRCQAEYAAAFKKHKGNLEFLINSLSFATDAIIECYRGNCGTTCMQYSLVCGGTRNNRYSKPFLPSDVSKFNIAGEDENILRQCMAIRLSPSAIRTTKYNTNTQKTEAVNRMYSKVNPKTITFSRNFSPRIHSGIHTLNNGTANSIISKAKTVGSPIVPHSKCAMSLKSSQQREKYLKNYMKSSARKSSRASSRLLKYKLYDQKAADDHQECYRKDSNLDIYTNFQIGDLTTMYNK